MCSSVGRVSKARDVDFRKELNRMLESAKRGGPDDQGSFFEENVALGHRSLSIISFTFPFPIWMHRSARQFRSLGEEGFEVDRIFDEFESGGTHWSKCWRLAVLNQFKKKSNSLCKHPVEALA